MQPIDLINAYYIKLGRGGVWEESSIKENKMRIGWRSWPIHQINAREWDILRKQYRHEYKTESTATTDLNALKTVVESAPTDIWITFYASKLWWCRLTAEPVMEDEISKYRNVSGIWHGQDINGNQLLINQIPGSISKILGFRATICRIHEIDDLKRLINDEPSEAYKEILNAKDQLISGVEAGIKRLHWKDFETLVDLVFREAGWQRISVLGETMKFVDMELLEPITNDLYQVQVKSAASIRDFQDYMEHFSHGSYRKLYFVVHSPDPSLTKAKNDSDDIELIQPKRLAELVVESGLTNWLLKKIK